MAKNTKDKKPVKKEEQLTKKSYKNPMESLWAKIIVWALIVGMLGTVVIGLIIALINR